MIILTLINKIMNITQMINLQQSKKIIRTFEQFIPSHYTTFNQTQSHLHQEHSARLIADTHSKKEDMGDTQFPFGRTISKMIKIQFHQNQLPKQNNEIRIKRKMLTSSQKYQTRKKNNYATSLKQAYNRAAANQRNNQSFLTIGSHGIKKMDYTNTIFMKQYNLDEGDRNIKKRFHSGLPKKVQSKVVTQKREHSKVVVLKKSDSNRLEDLLFKNSGASRNPSTARLQKQEKNYLARPSRDGKVYSIQEYMPIRKTTAKKEPFVFGLSQKQLNPQKNRQKLMIYHDFLWKINYSNGMYIRASDQETTYRAFVGFGNNSNLIKSILKRRYWWTLVDKPEGCHFAWSQLKINSIFKDHQAPSQTKPSTIYHSELEVPQNLKTQPILRSQQGHQNIFNSRDILNWTRHMRKSRRTELTITQKTYKNRAQFISCKQIQRLQSSSKLLLHNHLQQNYYIGNKKSLFYHLKQYYELKKSNVFDYIPITFHISKGIEDIQFKMFQQFYQDLQKNKKNSDQKNMWIMKPGENTNRGNGITICYSFQEVRLRIKAKQKNNDGSLRTFIVQKYMEKPLLFKNRKFDIRHFLLLTSFNGILKAYWFPQGYIRTSSIPFSLKRNTSNLVHLTNEAIQKNAQEYGKYQKGNKVSYQKFQHYLNKVLDKKHKNCFVDKILPEMKELTLDAVRATYLNLDPQRRQHNFQLLGMDFMIDQNLKPWLIQINTNPCLELSSPLLSRIIPNMIQQTMRICVDPLFPAPDQWCSGKKMYFGDNPLQQNKYQLIFDESVDGQQLVSLFCNSVIDSNMGKIQQDEQTFQNDGVQEWQQK